MVRRFRQRGEVARACRAMIRERGPGDVQRTSGNLSGWSLYAAARHVHVSVARRAAVAEPTRVIDPVNPPHRLHRVGRVTGLDADDDLTHQVRLLAAGLQEGE